MINKCITCNYATENNKSLSNHLRYGCPKLEGKFTNKKEYRKAYSKKYRKENKEILYKREQEWRRNNIVRARELSRIGNIRYRIRNPESVKAFRKKGREKLRLEVLNAYNHKCQCCGETQREFLSIDHMNNNGAQHRRENKLGNAQAFYLWLKRNNYPKEFQVLCHNCNCAKGYYGGCPHVK